MSAWGRRADKGDISCKTAGKWLQFYLDGELDDANVRTRVSYHLERCKDCGLEAETYSRIKVAINSHAKQLDQVSIHRLTRFLEGLE